MEKEQLNSFKIIGIAVATTNENGLSAKDIGELWERFYSENIGSKIPNPISDDIYAVYTDYETDYTGKYTTIIGMEVAHLDDIPQGLTGYTIEGGQYNKYLAKGTMPNAIVAVWQQIWSEDKKLNRKYTADFEVYGSKSQNGADAEVAIYIAAEDC